MGDYSWFVKWDGLRIVRMSTHGLREELLTPKRFALLFKAMTRLLLERTREQQTDISRINKELVK